MSKRLTVLAVTLIFIFSSVIGRVAYISLSNDYSVNDGYNSYKIEIGKLYPYIYDRKGRALNNNTYNHVAVILPNEKCLNELDRLFTPDEINEITNELSKGYPVKRELSSFVNCDNIKIYRKIIENDNNMLCKHLLNIEYGGLEKYIHNQIGELYVNVPVNASGRVLESNTVELINNSYDSNEGVVISIDKEIQQICENAGKKMNKGAIVVLDVDTSRVLASVSIGNDYINRATSSYAIGSIFKLVVCACALENELNPMYECKGSITVGDTTFSCQNKKCHGVQYMKDAIANSCNCYFVNLALNLGAEKLYKTACELGFGKEYELYTDWILNSGTIPDMNDLDSKGELSLFSFGQGKLSDSPMHFASVIAAIANKGVYHSPTIEIKDLSGTKVLNSDVCETLMQYMHYVVTNGTGYAANYNNMTAGKTATAQSGIYNNGNEILNTWFAGIYPYNNPKYAIVVMCEDGKSGSSDCCPIFRTIVESIDKM